MSSGSPRIFADIEDPAVLRGQWRTAASLRGHKIVDMRIDGLKEPTQAEQDELRAAVATSNWMGWKYIPRTGAPGADVSYPTLFPTSAAPKEIQFGTGSLDWHRATWEQNPTQAHIVNALAELPSLEYGPALITHGPVSLHVPGRPVRQLR